MHTKISSILCRSRKVSNQKGIALILFVFLLGLVVTGIGIKFLSGGSYQIQRSVSTAETLAEAKAALIGHVVGGQSGAGVGVFPCAEDITSIGSVSEGQAGTTCSSTTVGRFAWRTIGAGPLTDANNDKLWYALSAGFRTVPINSDTVGGLSLDGVQNAAVALLFSPGPMLSTQARPAPAASNPPAVVGYLDGENSDGDQDFVTGTLSSSFNDKLAIVRPDDVFPVIEKRVLGEIKNYLLAYKATWGAFPFPATFSNPATASFAGTSSNSGGLLPIADAGVTWASGTAVSVRTSNGSVRNGACIPSGTTLTCTIPNQNYNGSRIITINANLNNVGLGFYKKINLNSDLTTTPSTLKGRLNITTSSYSLNGLGGGNVTLQGTTTLRSNPATGYTLVFQVPQRDDWNTTTAIPNYIYQNKWHHLVYYKVAAPFLPGGSGTCGVCLTVNAVNVAPNVSLSGKHAVLMAAGRKLNVTNARPSPVYSAASPAQVRPGTLLADYFDSSNNISGGMVFDSTTLPLATFNDQVQIVE